MNSTVDNVFSPLLIPSPGSDSSTSEFCFHCGTECAGETIIEEEHSFCCSGCATVFHLLQANGLSDFYSIGNRQSPKPLEKGKYGWLEDEAISISLLDFHNDSLARVTFRLPTMHCAACIWLLEHLFKVQPGILRSEVDFPRKEIALDYNPKILNLRQVVELLDVLGYPPQLNLADSEGTKRNRVDRRSWYNLGIVGFCFGNIMMMSFPEYLGIQHSTLSVLFNWIILGLSIPVLYSSRGYFKSAWAGLKHRYINMDLPIALGISVLFIRSSWDVVSQLGHGYFDSLAGLVFFLLIGKIYQDKTYHLLSFDRDYRSYFPISVTQLKAGKEEETPVNKLEPGDTILIRNGELIPADGILVKGKTELDYSFVTGESTPVPVDALAKVFAGGRQIGKAIEVKLVGKMTQGYLPRLWNNQAFRKTNDARVTQLSSRIAKWFTPAVLLIASVAGLFWYFHDPSQIWNVVTSVLIVACPCALALSTPFTLGHILRILGRRGFFLKGPAVVERLADLDHIVFDKTGTLTHSENRTVKYEGDQLSPKELSAVRCLVRESVHPLSRQLYSFLPDSSIGNLEDFEEIPSKGLKGAIDGMNLRIGSAKWLGSPTGINPQGEEGASVTVEIDGFVKGVFLMKQELREGISNLLDSLNSEYQLSMVSGDHNYARKIFQPLMKGAELKFRQKPEDKLVFVEKLQANGQTVGMVGDGLNDSGALKQSDVGIAITDELAAFTPASDAILQGNSITSLPQFFRLSRIGIRLIHLSFGISLLYNVLGLWFAVTGELSPLIAAILMPASSLSVVLFTSAGVAIAAKKIFNRKSPTK